jgi:hypothetical protein
MYAYCGNNPVIGYDPSGEFIISITTAILIGSAILGGGAAVYTGYKMREAGAGWGDTLLYSAGTGLAVFSTVYTLGISAYELYYNMSWYYGHTPATHIGNPQNGLEAAASNANARISGQGPVAGTKKHTEFKNGVDSLNNNRIGTEVSYKNGECVPYATPGSVRFDAVLFDKYGNPIQAWDFKTGSAILTDARISFMQSHLPRPIPISMIK